MDNKEDYESTAPEPLDTTPMAVQEQLDVVEGIKALWLRHMARMLQKGTITSTDMATIARVLLANGWVLDARKLPKGLRDKLTSQVDVAGDEEEWPQLKAVK